MAEYFGVTTSLVRPVYVGLWLVLGVPLLLYLWWWLSLPVGTAANGQIGKPVTTPRQLPSWWELGSSICLYYTNQSRLDYLCVRGQIR